MRSSLYAHLPLARTASQTARGDWISYGDSLRKDPDSETYFFPFSVSLSSRKLRVSTKFLSMPAIESSPDLVVSCRLFLDAASLFFFAREDEVRSFES